MMDGSLHIPRGDGSRYREPLRDVYSPALGADFNRSQGSSRFPIRHHALFAVECVSIDHQQSIVGRVVRLFLFAVITLAFFSLPMRAQSEPTEYEVKAAYLYNFGKFVKWPPNTVDPTLDICIIGDNPFRGALQSMVAGEKIGGKPARVRQLDSVRDAGGCNIVFVSRSDSHRVRAILASVDTKPMLTVSDIAGFTNDGGIIEFVNESGRVRFNINLSAAQRAGLNLSSELLKVASSVKGKP